MLVSFTKCNFDGSIAIERPTVEAREFGELAVTAQQRLRQPTDAYHTGAEALKTHADIEVRKTKLQQVGLALALRCVEALGQFRIDLLLPRHAQAANAVVDGGVD